METWYTIPPPTLLSKDRKTEYVLRIHSVQNRGMHNTAGAYAFAPVHTPDWFLNSALMLSSSSTVGCQPVATPDLVTSTTVALASPGRGLSYLGSRSNPETSIIIRARSSMEIERPLPMLKNPCVILLSIAITVARTTSPISTKSRISKCTFRLGTDQACTCRMRSIS